MYSRPRCACLACSDLSQPASSEVDGDVYRYPTTRTIYRDDDNEVYYNSNEVDVDQLHAGCSCFGGRETSTAVSVNTAGRQGRPLSQANYPLTTCTSQHMLSAKLHYADTGYGHVAQHHQRTSSQQFYNNFATSQCQSPTSRHVKMLGCGKFVSVGGEFVVQQVVELL